MDKEWLKNAASFLKVGKNRNRSSVLVNTKVQFTCRDLYEKAIQSVELFNLYSGDEQMIRNFTLKRHDPLGTDGFLLMLGKYRVKLYLNKQTNELVCEYDQISGYTYNLVDRYIYTLYKDEFGAVLWGLDEKFLMNQETILQYVLAKLFEFVKKDKKI